MVDFSGSSGEYVVRLVVFARARGKRAGETCVLREFRERIGRQNYMAVECNSYYYCFRANILSFL